MANHPTSGRPAPGPWDQARANGHFPEANVEVVDAIGRIVRTVRSPGSMARINILDLATGYYTWRITKSDAVINSGVFVKM